MEQVGRYRVVDLIARGGMGAVFKGLDPQGGLVAIKLPLFSGSDAQRRRFQREVEALLRVSHPHVVRLVDAGNEGRRPYLVTEWIEGEDLGARLARCGPLPPPEAAELVRQVALAVEHCHLAGVLHRDIKPANVLLRRADGAPLLADFGLTRAVDDASRLSLTGRAVGTPECFAPEQAFGRLEEIGPATDVFGLGGLLFTCLTGEPPLGAPTVVELLQELTRPIRRARALRASVPARLDEICARALALAPTDRYPSAQALADDLARWQASPPPRSRARALVLGLAAVALAGTAALVVAREPRSRPAGSAAPSTPAAPVPSARPDPGAALLAQAERAWWSYDLDRTLSLCDALLSGPPAHHGAARVLRAQVFRSGSAQAERFLPEVERARALELDPTQRELLDALSIRDPRRACEVLDRALARWPDSLALRYWRAKLRGQAGDPQGALTDGDELLRRDPSIAQAWADRGAAAFALGRNEQAAQDMDRALALCDSGMTRHNRACVRLRMGDAAGALADLDRSLELRPDEPTTLEVRARLHLSRDELAAAERDLTRAVQLAPRQYLVHHTLAALHSRREDLPALERELTIMLELDPPGAELAELHYERARCRWAARDTARALEDVTRALELAPENTDALFLHASLLAEQRDDVAAVAELDEVIARTRQPQDALFQRARCRDRLGDLRGAREDCGQVIALARDPADRGLLVRALEHRARLHEALEDPQAGLADLDRAIALAPSVRLYGSRGVMRAAAGDPGGAIPDFDRALELARGGAQSASLLFNRGIARSQAGDTEGALSDLERATELDPREPRARIEHARLICNRGDPRGAVAELDSALAVDPRQGVAWVNRSAALCELGEFEAAIADSRRALELDPSVERPAHINLAVAHAALGDPHQALPAIDRVVGLSPADAGPIAMRGRVRHACGDLSGARADLLRAAELDPQEPRHAAWLAALCDDRSLLDRHVEGEWPVPLCRFMQGALDADGLLAQAQQGLAAHQAGQRAEAHCFLALQAERRGDLARARREYEACLAEQVRGESAYRYARGRLAGWDRAPR